jgi:hypothetical protein
MTSAIKQLNSVQASVHIISYTFDAGRSVRRSTKEPAVMACNATAIPEATRR